ncbi:hypothetical protein L6Q21_10280 [Sandaracinobacter sp. RS1-74]|uniref:hypothetical protein n=1 Tax=Sandaracinobacteroides sayramensis TaxID=2913411 RepID=UPI001EDB404C|nr:hypothetical protein [Sandaracinobacteroides sayramensis]MCG2841367.1 hypothetical protein [Sandaracinobacteroides sayramensis]
MSDNIDHRVSGSLHPDIVNNVEGYDEETSSILAGVRAAFAEAYRHFGQLHDAAQAAKEDPTLTEAAQLLQTADFGSKVIAVVAPKFDSARKNLESVVEGIEREFSAPLEGQTHGVLSGEIRSFCKGLDTGERMDFVRKAILDGDTRSASAVLGAPAYLSGLTPEMQQVLTRMFHAHHHPLQEKRLKVAKAGLELLDRNAGLIFKEVEKAVGPNARKIEHIRNKKAAASKAMTLPKA